MNSDEYVSQVLDFRLHLDNMDITPGSDEQHITAFYESDWEIKINGKSVTISNEADFFYRMVDLFDKYIALSL